MTPEPDEKEAVRETGTSEGPAKTPAKRRVRRSPAKATPASKADAKPRVEALPLKPFQVRVYDLDGKPTKSIELPEVFRSDVRQDLIRRAVTAFQANRRQTYAASPKAGMRHSVRWSGKGQGVSRVPRIRGTMIGAQAPGTVGGRAGHPPRLEKIWSKKINEKERRLARNGALAALRDPSLVAGRGHRFNDELSLPVVVEDALEGLESKGSLTKAGVEVLVRLGVFGDVERAKDGTHVRAGRGKMRGRRYRVPTSLLVVVKDPLNLRRALGNLPGVDIIGPAALDAEVLAPGGHPGRLALFTEGALESMRSWRS